MRWTLSPNRCFWKNKLADCWIFFGFFVSLGKTSTLIPAVSSCTAPCSSFCSSLSSCSSSLELSKVTWLLLSIVCDLRVSSDSCCRATFCRISIGNLEYSLARFLSFCSRSFSSLSILICFSFRLVSRTISLSNVRSRSALSLAAFQDTSTGASSSSSWSSFTQLEGFTGFLSITAIRRSSSSLNSVSVAFSPIIWVLSFLVWTSSEFSSTAAIDSASWSVSVFLICLTFPWTFVPLLFFFIFLLTLGLIRGVSLSFPHVFISKAKL